MTSNSTVQVPFRMPFLYAREDADVFLDSANASRTPLQQLQLRISVNGTVHRGVLWTTRN
eukprot:3816455-Lingulodinium_polyedra.AAC.1